MRSKTQAGPGRFVATTASRPGSVVASVPLLDLPLQSCSTYRSATSAPSDLDEFWQQALASARASAVDPVLTPYEPDAYGALAAYRRHLQRRGRRPDQGVVPAAGRGRRHARLRAASRSSATAADATSPRRTRSTRPAGTRRSSWTRARRAARGRPAPRRIAAPARPAPEHPGVMSRGIAAPETYYYRRLYVDAVRAVETAAGPDGVDAGRIAVAGHEPGRRARACGGGARAGARPAVPRRRPVPLRHRARDGRRARPALHRARHVPLRPSRARGQPPAARSATSTTPSSRLAFARRRSSRVGLRDTITPPVDGLRRVQRDHGAEGDRGLSLRRARRTDRARRAPALGVRAELG